MRCKTFCFAASLLVGCDEGDDWESNDDEELLDVIEAIQTADGTEVLTFRAVVDNGEVPNGFELNGFRHNGFRHNGFRHNGFRHNSFQLGGSPVTNVQYNPSTGSLQGTDGASNTVMLGAGGELLAQGDLNETTYTEIKASEIEAFTVGGQSFQFQRVQTRVLPNGTFEDSCLDGAGNPTKAILLKGDWTTGNFARSTAEGADQATTWACRGAALAKCVEWGYHPERVVSSTVLSDHHQACTRLVRADYCGDGNHHTENGTLIDVADDLGIQTHDTSWSIEAAWGPSGALCLNNPRKTYWTRASALSECSSVPACDDADGDGNPSNDVAYWFAQGALFVTRNQPTALSTGTPSPGDTGG